MSEGLPRAHVAHRIPHRLRVEVPSRKGDRPYFERVAQRLAGHASVRSVRPSPRTASVTIEHDGQAQDVAQLARELDAFDLPEAAVAQVLADRGAARVIGVEPSSLVSAGLAGLGVLQVARGNLLGSAVDHLWQAYGAARMPGSLKIAAVMALLGAYQMSRGRVLNPAASLFFYVLMVRAASGRR
jgi:hypothetical protein